LIFSKCWFVSNPEGVSSNIYDEKSHLKEFLGVYFDKVL
jgi:hypothetical protein